MYSQVKAWWKHCKSLKSSRTAGRNSQADHCPPPPYEKAQSDRTVETNKKAKPKCEAKPSHEGKADQKAQPQRKVLPARDEKDFPEAHRQRIRRSKNYLQPQPDQDEEHPPEHFWIPIDEDSFDSLRIRLGFRARPPPAAHTSPYLIARDAARAGITGILAAAELMSEQPTGGPWPSDDHDTWLQSAALTAIAIRTAASTSQSYLAFVAAAAAAEGCALVCLERSYLFGGYTPRGYTRAEFKSHLETVIDTAVTIALAAVEQAGSVPTEG